MILVIGLSFKHFNVIQIILDRLHFQRYLDFKPICNILRLILTFMGIPMVLINALKHSAGINMFDFGFASHYLNISELTPKSSRIL